MRTKECQVNSSVSLNYFIAGLNNFEKKLHTEAIKNFKLAIENSYTGPEIHSYLGKAYMANKNYTRAIEAFDNAVCGGLRNADSYYDLASAYYKRGNYLDAISTINSAILSDIKDQKLYYLLGKSYYLTDYYRKSINAFYQANRLGLDTANLYFNRGHVYLEQQKYPQAIRDLVISTSKDDKNSLAFLNLAECYHATKEYTKAYDTSKKAIAAKIGKTGYQYFAFAYLYLTLFEMENRNNFNGASYYFNLHLNEFPDFKMIDFLMEKKLTNIFRIKILLDLITERRPQSLQFYKDVDSFYYKNFPLEKDRILNIQKNILSLDSSQATYNHLRYTNFRGNYYLNTVPNVSKPRKLAFFKEKLVNRLPPLYREFVELMIEVLDPLYISRQRSKNFKKFLENSKGEFYTLDKTSNKAITLPPEITQEIIIWLVGSETHGRVISTEIFPREPVPPRDDNPRPTKKLKPENISAVGMEETFVRS